jgi:hypothetical protein
MPNLRSFSRLTCHMLIGMGLLLGATVAMGQELSSLPDAPQPNQAKSNPPNPEQNNQQHEASKNHVDRGRYGKTSNPRPMTLMNAAFEGRAFG